jgi:glycosyltransferase involved in cell wall biosynthesis
MDGDRPSAFPPETRPHVLITYPFPLGKATGGARMTREIARHVDRAGARVKVLPVSADVASSVFPRRAAREAFLGREFDAELARDGVEVVRVAPSRVHWALDGRVVRRAVAAILRRERVDAVLSYFAEAAALPGLLARERVPFGFIATWQSYARVLEVPFPGVPAFLQARAKRRLGVEPHRAAQVLFATSDFTRRELTSALAISPERIEVMPLGVAERFLEIPREPPPAITNLLFFGRLIPSKGVFDAVAALARLSARSSAGFRLRCVGQGDREAVLRHAREAGLGDRVEVAGPVDDEGLVAELAHAHLAVLPSRFESFGLAFAEAQAAGLAVVAYAAGSVPEIVLDGETGWLAPTGDVDGLAARLIDALADPRETFARGLAGRERVRREFTWERTAATILSRLRGRPLAAGREEHAARGRG